MTEKAWQVSKKNGRTVELGGGRKMTVPACPADPPQAWRDAKVIAAAPDMFAALKWVAESAIREGDEFGMWAAVDAAIAKAEKTIG